MFNLLHALSLTEKILSGALVLIILISSFQIGDAFYRSHSEPIPGSGGTYVEGVIGEFQFLNPVLAQTDLDRDITNLTACGLTRFDPISNEITDDLATHVLSPDQRTYTFTLKENALWHDGMPVTADDVVFTFREVIQHEAFPNPALAADFANVQITKIDERTVTMTLREKYAFFVYNTAVGILPKHILKDALVENMLSLEYNLHPIGCGPYQIEAVTGSQIRLNAFTDYFSGAPLLDKVVVRIFQSAEQLYRNLDGITGTKDLASDQAENLKNDSRLTVHEFTLPQYVALFFNSDRSVLKDKNTRLGLQLATNKEAIAEEIGNVKIIDTPLLEIDTSNWKYEPSAERADGALYDAGWSYPGSQSAAKKAAVAAVQPDETAAYITQPSSDRYFTTDKTEFFLQGTAPAGTTAVIVNGYQLKTFAAGSTWTYKASTAISTLKDGENEYIVEGMVNGAKQELDRLTVWRGTNAEASASWLAAKTTNEMSHSEPVEEPHEETKEVDENAPRLRQNEAGETLSLHLIFPADREEFVSVADMLSEQWLERGVEIILEPLSQLAFFERLNSRDYDMALFGQNLGYNLDAYPFWHSSEARPHGSNLSNLRSSAVNAWLEQTRSSFNSSERRKRLASLREAIADEVPAIMLYTPTYSFVIDKKIKNFNLGRIALKRDRLSNLPSWYVRESREIQSNIGIFAFLKWFWQEAL